MIWSSNRFPWLQSITGVALACMVGITLPIAAQGAEWEESTPYYEDDAWYDVTEWLDGNDYNPTDEVVGRWDSEVYDSGTYNTDYDADTSYGYQANDNESASNDDWYYDFYDDDFYIYDIDPYNDGVYDYSSKFYDYDNDGLYDAYASYYDWDNDGLYEDIEYVTLNNLDTGSDETKQAAQNAQQQSRDASADMSSKKYKVQGDVQQTKKVDVRSGKHMVVQVKSDQGTFAVDLGPADNASQWNLQQGDSITAYGPMMSVGDKKVLLARSLQLAQGEQQKIDRGGTTITGSVKKLKSSKVRDTQHQLAILSTDQNQKQVLVDLGPADQFSEKLATGDQVKVRGVPVRINDRPAFLANQVTMDGKTVEVDRRKAKPSTQGAEKQQD